MNINNNSMFSMMYQNAVHDLYAGILNPVDREILFSSSLPSDIVDPFASLETDPLTTMSMAYSAMTVWIEEAKKANYFSEHFTRLSKMIMNGCITMARGLMSLHMHGEDLSQAPMSINELISLGSYHIRKSYLGVLQTAKSHPEISERLLINQLGWTNTLMRLYKTKEKLFQPIRINQESDDRLPVCEGGTTPLPEACQTEQICVKTTASKFAGGFREISALPAASAYAAPRAFTALDGGSVHTKVERVSNRNTLPSEKTSNQTERALKTPETEIFEIETKNKGQNNQKNSNDTKTKENKTPVIHKEKPEAFDAPSTESSGTDSDAAENNQNFAEIPGRKKRASTTRPAVALPVTPHRAYPHSHFIVGKPP